MKKGLVVCVCRFLSGIWILAGIYPREWMSRLIPPNTAGFSVFILKKAAVGWLALFEGKVALYKLKKREGIRKSERDNVTPIFLYDDTHTPFKTQDIYTLELFIRIVCRLLFFFDSKSMAFAFFEPFHVWDGSKKKYGIQRRAPARNFLKDTKKNTEKNVEHT